MNHRLSRIRVLGRNRYEFPLSFACCAVSIFCFLYRPNYEDHTPGWIRDRDSTYNLLICLTFALVGWFCATNGYRDEKLKNPWRPIAFLWYLLVTAWAATILFGAGSVAYNTLRPAVPVGLPFP